jgi:hypothetical protein
MELWERGKGKENDRALGTTLMQGKGKQHEAVDIHRGHPRPTRQSDINLNFH